MRGAHRELTFHGVEPEARRSTQVVNPPCVSGVPNAELRLLLQVLRSGPALIINMANISRARRAAPPRATAAELVLPDHEGIRAVRLVSVAREAGMDGVIYVVGSEAKIERMARLLWALAPDIEALVFPPWDCLPYDRSPPSARTMGLRGRGPLLAGRRPDRPWILITTSEGSSSACRPATCGSPRPSGSRRAAPSIANTSERNSSGSGTR
jgi:hypothetical protein